MKYQILSLLACLAFIIGLQMNAQAQRVIDSTLVFNEATTFDVDRTAGFNIGMPPTVAFDVTPSTRNIFVHITAAQAKAITIPRATRVSNKPITLKHKGVCYQFGCAKGEGKCANCKLFWNDRNKDGKVQPRRELRCVCATGNQCKIRVRRSECK